MIDFLLQIGAVVHLNTSFDGLIDRQDFIYEKYKKWIRHRLAPIFPFFMKMKISWPSENHPVCCHNRTIPEIPAFSTTVATGLPWGGTEAAPAIWAWFTGWIVQSPGL